MTKKTTALLQQMAQSLQEPQTNYDIYTEGKMETAIRLSIDEALCSVGDRLAELLEEYKSYNDDMETIDDE